MNKTIKTGNPFSTLVIMRDSKTREAIEITDDMQITSTIVNTSGQEIANCKVIKLNQNEVKGGFTLNVDQATTSTWKVGTAIGDIKVNGKNSCNYSFNIEKSIS